MKNFLTDFGFNPSGQIDFLAKKSSKDIELSPNEKRSYQDIKFGTNAKKRDLTLFWTLLVYIFFSFGIFLRRTVSYPDPVQGVDSKLFTFSIIAASFIIGLALLAPLLRAISKIHRGKLSWQHCLTAFSIGFFGDMTFTLLTNQLVDLLKVTGKV